MQDNYDKILKHFRTPSGCSSVETEVSTIGDECIICFSKITETDNAYSFTCCKNTIHLNCYLEYIHSNIKQKSKEINCIFCRKDLKDKEDVEIIIKIEDERNRQRITPRSNNIIQTRNPYARFFNGVKKGVLTMACLYTIASTMYYIVDALSYGPGTNQYYSVPPPFPPMPPPPPPTGFS